MRHDRDSQPSRRPQIGARSLTAYLLPLTLVGLACTDVTTLTQSNPGALGAATVYTPINAQLIVNGAIGDFECAFSRYVVGSGVFDGELTNAIASGSNYDYNRRTLHTSDSYGTGTCGSNQQPPIYTTLSIARASADTAAAKLQGWTDAQVPASVNRTKLIGQSLVYAGYSVLLLGEGMCSAAINVGPEETPAQLFADAITRFNAAVTAASTAGDTTTQRLATLLKARAELNMGNAAAAAVDAATIPSSFRDTTSNDAINSRRENFSYVGINLNSWESVDPSFRNLTINGQPDPRVALTAAKGGTAPGVQMFTPNKYPALNTPMPIARWAEAQYIIAEADVAAGNLSGAAAAINAVRATHSIAAYDPTGQSASQVLAQVVEERRRELFLEGYRLGDMRRLNIPFTNPAGTPYSAGGTYGTETAFPLPDVERINNPHITKVATTC